LVKTWLRRNRKGTYIYGRKAIPTVAIFAMLSATAKADNTQNDWICWINSRTTAVNIVHESGASKGYSPAEDATELPLHLQGNSNNRLPKQAGTLPYIFKLKTQ